MSVDTRLFRRLAETVPVGVAWVTGDGRIVYANDRLSGLFGGARAATVAEQFAVLDPPGRQALDRALADAARALTDRQLEVWARGGEGGARRYLMTVAALSPAGGGPGVILTVSCPDGNAPAVPQQRGEAPAPGAADVHDRGSTLTVLDQILARPQAAPVAVLAIGLAHLPSVVASHGQAVADRLLVVVARRLHEQVRGSDTLGRLGDDEFLLVCPGVRDGDQAVAIAQRFQRSLRGRTHIDGHVLQAKVSVGVTLSRPGVTADQLVAQADSALHTARRHGTEEPALFDR